MFTGTRRLLGLGVLALLPFAVNAQSVFVNELHYDNDSTDEGEGVEVAGPAGTDLTGWTIVLYNGAASSRAPYGTINLGGTIPNQQDGYGTLFFRRAGIQNGAPDGLALVNASNAVVQFLSYEGSFVANGGPADGMTSTDIGVFETDDPPLGQSLQLTGTGSTYSDFSWSAPQDTTYGLVNTNQRFVAPVPSGKISPILDSLVTNCDGTYTAFFGYLNRNSTTVTIPVGTDNRFSPAPQDRGQTTAFLAGRQQNAFAVTYAGGNLVWTLRSPNGQQATATAGSGNALPPQGCGCPSPAPSYAGGYVLNTAQTRAFVEIQVPAGATQVQFYRTSNLIVGDPEADPESATAITNYTRTGDTFDFSNKPKALFFPIINAGSGPKVSFFLQVTDDCGRTVDVDPNFVLTGISPDALTGFALAPAAPTPTSGRTKIAFSLESRAHVTLTAYDVLGREVARLVDSTLDAGPHAATLDASSLPSGVYVYRLVAGGQMLTRSLTVTR